ncbi:MAG: class II fructose-bisphosphate aldolase [Chloroflexota bacterium]
MPLASTGSIVAAARSRGGGAAAFNVIGLEHAEGLVAGAEAAGAPLILAISENCVRYHGRLAPIALASLDLAARAAVPIAIHLDHVEDAALVDEGLALGIRSVMFDASKLPYEENLAATREVAARCHAVGAWLEAELGEVGGKDGVHAPGARTDPAEAAAFVAATGVDALAVAVGTSHAMTTRDTALDLALIGRLRAAVPVPLVLHGSSGVPDDELGRAIEAGMTKINVSTHLNHVFTDAIRGWLEANPTKVDPRGYLKAGRQALAAETARLLGVLRAG